nr:trehalase-like [Leptinotarsa decemlineata]
MKKLWEHLLFFMIMVQLCSAQTKQSCHSAVYCQGDLLHLVQTAKIFNDSKTFVDMAMIHPLNETLKRFQLLMSENDEHPTREQIKEFVYKNFKSIGELDEYYPRDFKHEPKIIKEITDPVVRKFAQSLIDIWPTLTRTVSYHVIDHPETHSLIPVPHPFVIPGGRFKELYYWDTYWILKGLLLSDMVETARGMIQNLLSMVERFGFVPNGGRIYYLNRSQPPLLTQMVADYVKYTKDFEFLRNNINTLEKELQFWLTKRLVTIEKGGKTYELARYDSESDTPRPESYWEDIETCSRLTGEKEKMYECYADLKSGAESGMDFTSRWMFDKFGEPTGNLADINTRRIIPVDLNGFLYKAFKVMYKFNLILQREEEAKFWLDKADQWKNSIENIFYNEEDGIWYDFDEKLGKQRKHFYVSNFLPLWAGAMDDNVKEERGRRAAEYLKKKGIVNFQGGIPSTLLQTGQQWDFPNAWPPYQNLIIIGLDKSNSTEAKEVAKQLAHKWINSNIKGFHDNKAMFEKYDVQTSGQFGGGGEYNVQAGFGWSNGGILELIHLYYRAKTRKYIGSF